MIQVCKRKVKSKQSMLNMSWSDFLQWAIYVDPATPLTVPYVAKTFKFYMPSWSKTFTAFNNKTLQWEFSGSFVIEGQPFSQKWVIGKEIMGCYGNNNQGS